MLGNAAERLGTPPLLKSETWGFRVMNLPQTGGCQRGKAKSTRATALTASV